MKDPPILSSPQRPVPPSLRLRGAMLGGAAGGSGDLPVHSAKPRLVSLSAERGGAALPRINGINSAD